MPADSEVSLVSTEELAALLKRPDVKVCDASYPRLGDPASPRELFEGGHIPGALLFDIGAISDSTSPLPNMLPQRERMEEALAELGIANDDWVIVYDRERLMSAGRAWWMLGVFGHSKVSILDGGLPKWIAEGRLVEAGRSRPVGSRSAYRAVFHDRATRSMQEMFDNIAAAKEQVIDARPPSRFSGADRDHQSGRRAGHIPGSYNLPYTALTDPQTGKLRKPAELRLLFEEAGIDYAKPVVATCGSGVSACALVFGLYLTGKTDVAVYDGSWAEWGQHGEHPVERGERWTDRRD